jgi:ribonuclease VapC
MMAVDTSALLAIFFGEPEAADFATRILAQRRSLVSVASMLEGFMVVTAREQPERISDFQQLATELDLEIMPFDAMQLGFAQSAFVQFGKGRHPARLNYGDCISYALAKAQSVPLLFKGDDLGKTDVEIA